MLLPGIDRVVKDHAAQTLLALTPEQLYRQPHLYLQRLLSIPQLPAGHRTDLETSSLVATNVSERPAPHPAREQFPPETRYQTGWDCLTFEDLYEQTYRYASYLLKTRSPASQQTIEDALQVSYLKLWQKVENNPQYLAQRTRGSIVRQILYGALHTLHKEHNFNKRYPSFTQLDPKGGEQDFSEPVVIHSSSSIHSHSHESRQTDQRIDLHSAIATAAHHILAETTGIKLDRALWALYCMTMLHVYSTEASQLFRVNEKAMRQAYTDVRQRLQNELHNYAPRSPTRLPRNAGQNAVPYQDITAIRHHNQQLHPQLFEEVRHQLKTQRPDTLQRDLLALEGIQNNVPARQLGRLHNIPMSAIQRAYERVHLLLGSLHNPTVTQRRLEKKRLQPFVFTPEAVPFIQQLAQELLAQPNHHNQIVALYTYLCNLPIRTTARHFSLNEGTLRRHRHILQERMTALSQASVSNEIQDEHNQVQRSSDPTPSSWVTIETITDESEACLESQTFPQEMSYQTRWAGLLTFEAIFTDRNVRNVAFSKMRSFGYTDEDAEDCFQLGALNLWKKLQEQPDLLNDKGVAWVGVYIALSGSRRSLRKHNARAVSLDRLTKKETSGEGIVDGYVSRPPEHWARFATRVDERIDFALLMSALAQRYEEDPIKLFALYSLTTSVKMKDVLPIIRANKNQFIQVRHTVKQDLKSLLEENSETDLGDEYWGGQNQNELENIKHVAERVMRKPRLLLALYVTTTSAKRKDIMELFKLCRTEFRKDIVQIKQMLTQEARKLRVSTLQKEQGDKCVTTPNSFTEKKKPPVGKGAAKDLTTSESKFSGGQSEDSTL